MKHNGKVDYRSLAGIMLRGKNVYNGASQAPNPRGRNQWSTLAGKVRKHRKMKK